MALWAKLIRGLLRQGITIPVPGSVPVPGSAKIPDPGRLCYENFEYFLSTLSVTNLVTAVSQRDHHQIAHLLGSGSSRACPNSFDPGTGMTVLAMACAGNDFLTVQHLLENGAQVGKLTPPGKLTDNPQIVHLLESFAEAKLTKDAFFVTHKTPPYIILGGLRLTAVSIAVGSSRLVFQESGTEEASLAEHTALLPLSRIPPMDQFKYYIHQWQVNEVRGKMRIDPARYGVLVV